jgi:predicted enzyme related to lactoylglutathione lyase
MDFNIKSLYLCVGDMNRAITFYEELLEQTVTIHDDVYSVFDINGFRLGLFAYEKMNEYHTFGNNCLPSLEVRSVDILKSKLSKLKIAFPLTQIGKNWVAEFEDSEGNHIEITTPIEKTDDINFGISNEFKSEYLTPIVEHLLFKAEND